MKVYFCWNQKQIEKWCHIHIQTIAENKIIKIKDVLCFAIVTIGRNIHRNKIYQIKTIITVSEKTTTTNDNSNIIYTNNNNNRTINTINIFDKKTNINNKINDNNNTK